MIDIYVLCLFVNLYVAQCVVSIFKNLLPGKDDKIVGNLSFELVTWHVYAKLHLYTGSETWHVVMNT